jgi:ABC-type sugar transport system ATPase subunit
MARLRNALQKHLAMGRSGAVIRTGGINMTVPFLQATGITKRFGALTALRDVDLEINGGEVLALLGDNGAGKSTFIKILAGAHPQSDGELSVEGQPVTFSSPKDAAGCGIATIFQELALSENLSISENVFLGRELKRSVLGVPFLRRKAMRERVDGLLRELDAHISDPEATVGSLSGGQRQAVAICRALNLNAKLVIMDEPTAALAVAETRKVLQLTRRLAERGCAVVLISHNIADVFEVADRMVVFRRGRKVAERRKEATTPEEIVSLITGAHPDVRALEQNKP